MFDSMTTWVESTIETIGYLGVAFLVALENVFPPIPSEVVLPFAGFTASGDQYSLVGMILAATAGSMVGAWVLYGISAWIGPVRLRAIVVRYGKWLGVKEKDLTRAEEWFDRRSNVAVLVGRCVPLIRSIVSVPAGFRRLPLLKFTVLTAIGSLVWNVGLIGAGYLLGDNWDDVGPVMEQFQLVVLVVLAAFVLWFVFTKLVRPRLVARRVLPADADDLPPDGPPQG